MIIGSNRFNLVPRHASTVLPVRRSVGCQTSSSTQQLQTQLGDDLDIIDALFDTAVASPGPAGSAFDAAQTGGTAAAAAPPAAGLGPAKGGHSIHSAVLKRLRQPPSLPKRATQLPWGSTADSAAAQQPVFKAAGSSKALRQLRSRAPATPAKPRPARSASTSTSRARSSSTSSNQLLGREYLEELFSDAEEGSSAAADAEPSVPVNPWLVRQQQQRQRQKAKQAKERAVRQQRLQAEQLAAQQQQQLRLQRDGQPESQLSDQRAIPHPSTSSSGSSTSSSSLLGSTGTLAPSPALQPLTAPHQLQLQLQQPAVDGIVRSSRRLRMQQATTKIQQQQQQQQQHTENVQPVPAIADIQQPLQKQQLAANAATAATIAADAPAEIGQAPLLVLGGRAAGSEVIWSQAASIAVPNSNTLAAKPKQTSPAPTKQGSSSSSRTTSSTSSRKAAAPSSASAAAPPAAAGAAAATTAAAGSAAGVGANSRYRRRARSLQGVVTGPGPAGPTPTPPAAPAAAADTSATTAAPAAAAAAVSSSNSWQLPGSDVPGFTTGSSSNSSTRGSTNSSSSSSSSTSSSRGVHELQAQLQGLHRSNWQQLAAQLLPELYDPSWHSSLYAFMQDMWRVVLVRAKKTAAQQQQQLSRSAAATSSNSAAGSPAAAWAVACLYHPRRYMWGSTVLALLDSLAEDDVGLAVHAVQLLPVELLEQLVLPAAAVLDDEVHAALLQAMKQQHKDVAGNSAAAGAGTARAVHPLIGPAPWAAEQLEQQQQHQGCQQQGSQQGQLCADGTSDKASSCSSSEGSSSSGGGGSSGLFSSDNQAAAVAAARAVPGGGQVLDALSELQQLQGLYPGVDLPGLAHVAQQHGLWLE